MNYMQCWLQKRYAFYYYIKINPSGSSAKYRKFIILSRCRSTVFSFGDRPTLRFSETLPSLRDMRRHLIGTLRVQAVHFTIYISFILTCSWTYQGFFKPLFKFVLCLVFSFESVAGTFWVFIFWQHIAAWMTYIDCIHIISSRPGQGRQVSILAWTEVQLSAHITTITFDDLIVKCIRTNAGKRLFHYWQRIAKWCFLSTDSKTEALCRAKFW
jgi:hypothetical protein